MAINEKLCPHCGHDVLSWEIVCPGCDLIPAETPEGLKAQRLVRARRFVIDEWPALAFFLFAGVLTVLWFLPGPRKRADVPIAAVPIPSRAPPYPDSVVSRVDSAGVSATLYAGGRVVVTGLLPLSYGADLTFPDLDSVQPTLEAMKNSPKAPPSIVRGPAVDWLLKTAVPKLRKDLKAKAQ